MTDGNHTIPCARCGAMNVPPAAGKWLGTQLCESCHEPTGAEARVQPTTLEELVAELEPDAREVVRRIAERLLHGQRKYGVIRVASDGREWRKELLEELFDAIVYRELREMSWQPVELAEALTRTQDRCTTLLEENRALKAQLEEVADTALVVEIDDDGDDEELFAPAAEDEKDHGSN